VRNITKIAAIGMAAAVSASVFAQGPRKDGRWEIKAEMSMPGMPMSMPPMTMTHCVTKEQAENPEKYLPQGPGQKCSVSDFKMDGNKATWKMTCQGPEAMTGTGEIVYKEDTFDSVMNMEGQGHKMILKAIGKRLGDCTE
jgi:hypothetical protein